MKSHQTLAIILATSLIHGCDDSNSKLPMIPGEFVFSCSDFITAKTERNNQKVYTMLQQTWSALDKEYISDTSIQRFYRNFVRKQPSHSAETIKIIESTCSNSANLELTDAASLAINAFYELSITQPKLAACEAYIAGDLDFSSIVATVRDTKKAYSGGSRIGSNTLRFIESEKYGEQYVERNLENYCSEHPDTSVWHALELSMQSETKAEMEEQIRLRREAEAREEEQQAEADLLAYGKNLTASNETNNCKSFQRLTELSRTPGPNQELYNRYRIETVTSLSPTMLPHQKLVLDELMKDPSDLADKIHSKCFGSGYETPIQDAMMKISEISEAKSPGYIYLSSLLNEKRPGRECSNYQRLCESKRDYRAAEQAFSNWQACERQSGDISEQTTSSILCFSTPEEAYQYQLSEQNIALLEFENERLLSSARAVTLDVQLVNECMQEIRNSGANITNYRETEIRECETPILDNERRPFILQIEENKKKIAEEQNAILVFENSATQGAGD